MVGHWIWVLALCASFLGWGASLARLFGLPRDAGAAGCLGVAFALGCGGLIDLLQIMGTPIAIGFVLIGVLLAAVQFLPDARLPRGPRLPAGLLPRLLLVVFVPLCALAIIGHIYYPEFHKTDDYSAYLAFPRKMLATGSLGFEPFSERLLLTSVGGMYFLHALVLAGADFFFLHVVDPALGLALTLLLLEIAMRRHGVVPAWRLGVLLFALLLMPEIVNLTAELLPVALMLFAYLLLEADPDVEPGPRSLGRVVALSLVGAAMVAIKSAYLPWVGSFLAFVYARRIVRDRFRARSWREPAAIAGMTLLLLLPWLLANLRDVGTALYPVLGAGFHTSRYGLFPPPWAMPRPTGSFGPIVERARTIGPQLLACGLIFALALRVSARSAGRTPGAAMLTLGFLLSCLVLVITIAVGAGLIDEVPRYSYPGVAAALLVALYGWVVTARGLRGTPRGRAGPALVVGVCLAVLSANVHDLVQYYGHAVTNLGMAVLGPGFRPAMLAGVVARDDGAERRAVLRMQQAIPAGAMLLERLDYPFLLDFRRNEVLIADWPGAAGPPPGMPVFQGPEKLAAYLLGAKVRFVAYAYANEAKFPASERNRFLRDPWVELDAKLAFDFQDDLSALMQTRRLLYKDDTRAVIDLAERTER